MSTVAQALDPVQRVLYDRPYLHRRYYPLAAFLCENEYSTRMRDRIIDFVADGGFLESLAMDGTLEADDLVPAQEALDSGRAWERAYRLRAEFPEPDPDSDDEWNDPTADPYGDPVYYENGEPAALPDFPDRTEDVEPFHPGFDPLEIQRMRDWYAANDFHRWLESQGGER